MIFVGYWKGLCLRWVYKDVVCGYIYLLLSHLWFSNSEEELLLLGALCSWQVSSQEVFERVCDLVLSDSLDVVEGFLGGGEWLVSGELEHLAESLDVSDSFLDLGELTACFVEFFLFEEAVS